MHKVWRKLAGFLGIGAVLFAQVAVAFHACPTTATGFPALEHAAASTPGVAGAEADNPALCQKHCQEEGQSVSAASDSPSSAAFSPGFVATLDTPVVASAWTVVAPATFLRSKSPPLPTRNCCFRS